MVSSYKIFLFLIFTTLFFSYSTAQARLNIVIGEVSIGYDFAERKYVENDDEVAAVVSVPAEDTVDDLTAETAVAAEPDPNETNDGDIRRWVLTPRIRLSSQGINDLIEFTYAPTFPFFTYDEYEDSDNIAHDFNLLAEKSFTRNWSVYINDNFYYGDDSLEDEALSESEIIPDADETEDDQTVGAEQTDSTNQSLREQNRRREYWRNTFDIGTDYIYAQDSVAGVGYTYGVLRNINDDDGYDEYDRHEGRASLSYRFNRYWRVETEAGYVRGYYDPTEVTYIQPEIVQVPVEDEEDDETEEDPADEEEETEIEYEEQTVYNESEEEFSDDLEEYHFLFRANYDWRTRDRLFSLYSYDGTDYESSFREDSAIHDITVGWSHDFTRAIHMTLSGGPSFVTYEESSTETGYNAYLGFIWDFQHAALTADSSYGYEFNNFDGDRTGLSQTWHTELGYSYSFSPQLSFSLFAGYDRSDNEEPVATTVLLDLEGEDTAEEVTDYTEETYDAGVTLSYNFLRWYTVSASYRYADYQSENDLDYDEHRVLLTLSASKELFRW